MENEDEQSRSRPALSEAELGDLLGQAIPASALEPLSSLSSDPSAPLAPDAPAMTTSAPGGPLSFQPHDFRQPSLIPAQEMRKLRLRHESFAAALAARLSIYLRLEFSAALGALQTTTYRKFVDALARPTHLTLFKVEPLPGVGLIEIPPSFALSIVDRLLGGPGEASTEVRAPSEIEASLLDQVVQLILSEWRLHVLNQKESRTIVLGHETDGRFLQTSPHDTALIVTSVQAGVGECRETIQIALPLYMIEPLLGRLRLSIEQGARPTPAAAAPPRWNAGLEDVQIGATAVWTGLEITARELSQLRVGDLLEMNAECLQQVRLCFNGREKFLGRLGTRGKTWAVELTQAL